MKFEPFQDRNLFFFKEKKQVQFQQINHEILTKGKKFTSLMIKSLKIFFVDCLKILIFLGFIFNCTSEIGFFGLKWSVMLL